MKKISYQSISSKASFNDNKPGPAINNIPTWFKKLPRFPDGKNKANGKGQISQTVKACSPFLDTFTTGYMIRLEFDVLVTRLEDGGHYFEWQEGDDLITNHNPKQVSPDQIPQGYSPLPFKFDNKYVIKTPPGYSTLFVHPLNRTDLPFHTLAGIVETDRYPLPVNLPFLIRQNFEGVLEAGTPIAQCIPIKRESWGHEVVPGDQQELETNWLRLRHKLLSSYKSQWWIRKEYK